MPLNPGEREDSIVLAGPAKGKHGIGGGSHSSNPNPTAIGIVSHSRDRWARVWIVYETDRYCFLIEIDVDARTTKVTPFPPEFIRFAHTKYLEAEQRNARLPHRSAVLATAYSLAALRAAYPSYYGDTNAFLQNTGLITELW
jgi:hypothetical protein